MLPDLALSHPSHIGSAISAAGRQSVGYDRYHGASRIRDLGSTQRCACILKYPAASAPSPAHAKKIIRKKMRQPGGLDSEGAKSKTELEIVPSLFLEVLLALVLPTYLPAYLTGGIGLE